MTTLSFEEYINFKTQNRYQDNLPEFFDIEQNQSFTIHDRISLFRWVSAGSSR